MPRPQLDSVHRGGVYAEYYNNDLILNEFIDTGNHIPESKGETMFHGGQEGPDMPVFHQNPEFWHGLPEKSAFRSGHEGIAGYGDLPLNR
jgi:hypothetical protein